MQEYNPRQEVDFQKELIQAKQDGDPATVYADSMREDKIRNVIAQINPELLLSEIEHRIRGEKKEYSGGVEIGWIPVSKNKELVSEELVQNYIAFLNAYLTQNNSLSNFSPEEINNIMEVIIDYIKDDLTDNGERYGLTKKKRITINRTVKIIKPKTNNDGTITMKEYPIEVKEEIETGDEITDYNEMTKIGHIVCQSTFSVLKQAQNGMLASRVFKALRVTESLNQGGEKSKLDFLKFW
jgi:hypothetical protein